MRITHICVGADTGGQSYQAKLAHEAAGDEVRVVAGSHNYMAYPSDQRWTPENLQAAYDWADIVVFHNKCAPYDYLDHGQRKPVIVHHHGTRLRGAWHLSPEDKAANAARVWAEGERIGATQIVSTVDLLLSAPGAEWQPGYIDVQRVAGFRQFHDGPARIAHAPTFREVKGTAQIEGALRKLKNAGGAEFSVSIIEYVSWLTCLALKGKADVYVDQLDLGYGMNAVECWAMQLPVLVGAQTPVLNRMRQEWGDLPFDPVTAGALPDILSEWIASPYARMRAAERGLAHTLAYHAYEPAVARAQALYQRVANSIGVAA